MLAAQVHSLEHIQTDLVQQLAFANRRADEAIARKSSSEPSDLQRQVTGFEGQVAILTKERDHLRTLADVVEPLRAANQ